MPKAKPGPLLPLLLEAGLPIELLSSLRMQDGGAGGSGTSGDGGDGGGGGAGGEPPKTFTQAELERIIGERLGKERAKYADYEDLKTKAARLEEIEAANRSEQEKAVDKARREAEEAARKEERGKAAARIVKAEIRAAAGGRLADPEDAVRLLDLSEFTVNDDGDVDGKAIKAAIDKLVESKPYLATSTGNGDGFKRLTDLGQGRRGSGSGKASVARGRELYESRHGRKTN